MDDAGEGKKVKFLTRMRERIGRLTPYFQKGENVYLELLRRTALVIASILLIASVGYLLVGLAMQIGPRSIEPEAVIVRGSDIAPHADTANAAEESAAPASSGNQPRWQKEIPLWFRTEYYTLYTTKFAPFNREGDQVVTRNVLLPQNFDDEFLDMMGGINPDLIVSLDENDTGSEAVWRMLLKALTESATNEQLLKELRAYRNARRTQICTSRTIMVSRRVQQWDRWSMSCPYWYEDYGCMVNRTITVPQTSRSCSMQFPAELSGPSQKMRELQQSFIVNLQNQLIESENNAAQATTDAATRRMRGWSHFSYGAQLFAGFMALMFCFLLVAIERHYRKISDALQKTVATDQSTEETGQA